MRISVAGTELLISYGHLAPRPGPTLVREAKLHEKNHAQVRQLSKILLL